MRPRFHRLSFGRASEMSAYRGARDLLYCLASRAGNAVLRIRCSPSLALSIHACMHTASRCIYSTWLCRRGRDDFPRTWMYTGFSCLLVIVNSSFFKINKLQ